MEINKKDNNMKKIAYLLSVLLAASVSNVRAMQSETGSESAESINTKIEDFIKSGDNNPQVLLHATQILSDTVDDARIKAKIKIVWYNCITQKSTAILKQTQSPFNDNDRDEQNQALAILVQSLNEIRPRIEALTAPRNQITNNETNTNS